MKTPVVIKGILKSIIPKNFGPKMSKYAQQYNLPSRKLARKRAAEKRKTQTRKMNR